MAFLLCSSPFAFKPCPSILRGEGLPYCLVKSIIPGSSVCFCYYLPDDSMVEL